MKREPPPIDPARTTLLVVDMQRGFLEPDGVMFLPAGVAIIPAVDSVVDVCRGAGIQVIWTRMSHEGMVRSAYPELFPQHFQADGSPKLRRGVKDFEIVESLQPAATDMIIDKLTYSSFGRTGLEGLLRDAGRDTVIVVGIATNVCVESTAREAFALGFRVIVISDAVTTGNAEAHKASLKTLSLAFGWVITGEQLRDCLATEGTTRPLPAEPSGR
jgi:nicotinamidase-related amidase